MPEPLTPLSDAVESLHAIASDLRHIASGGSLAPETLRAHADAVDQILDAVAEGREAVKGCGASWSVDGMEPDVCGTREFGVTLLCPSCLPTLWRALDTLTGARGDFGERNG